LTPALKESGLAGSVTMDLDVYIPYGEPTKSRLKGMLAARQVNLDTRDYTVRKTDADIDLSGNTAVIKRLKGMLNDQPLSANGQLTNPAAPDIRLAVTSPNVNLDRLLPATQAEAESFGPTGKPDKPVPKKSDLPPMAKKARANVTVTAEKGQYRGLAFQNLTFKALYEMGGGEDLRSPVWIRAGTCRPARIGRYAHAEPHSLFHNTEYIGHTH